MDKEDIVKLRAKLNLSMPKFAALFYVDYHTVSKWEKGLAKPHKSNVARLKEIWIQEFKHPYIHNIRVA